MDPTFLPYLPLSESIRKGFVYFSLSAFSDAQEGQMNILNNVDPLPLLIHHC